MVDEFYNGNGVWIPIEILHSSELTASEKLLYAEIYYLDRPDTHCYASNEYLAKFLGLSDSGLRKCLSHLKNLGYIQTISFDGRTRVLATTVKWSNQTATTVAGRLTQNNQSESYKNENLLLIENKKENNIEKPATPTLSKNHPRNFGTNKLTDDLCSGIVIDEQKKTKKKESKYDKCLAEIDKREFTDDEKLLLHQHIDWSFHSADVNRNNEPRKYARHLDELLKLSGDKQKIIQQSIDKQWHCFYEYKEPSKSIKRGGELLSDKIVGTDLEDARRRLKEAEDEEDY